MIVLTVGAMLCAASSLAVAADRDAVVSLVGDAITIVGYRAATGSNIDQNPHEQVAMGDGVFDRLATRVATHTRRRSPGPMPAPMRTSTRGMH